MNSRIKHKKVNQLGLALILFLLNEPIIQFDALFGITANHEYVTHCLDVKDIKLQSSTEETRL